MALAPCSNACEQRQPVCVALGLGQAGTRAACTRLAACHKYRWHASQRPRHWAPVAICGRLLPLHAATPCLLSRAGSIGARSRPPSWVLQLSKLGGRHADPAYHSHTMRTPHAHRVRCAGMHVGWPACVLCLCVAGRAQHAGLESKSVLPAIADLYV